MRVSCPPLGLGLDLEKMFLVLVPGTPVLDLADLLAGTASTPFGYYLQATRASRLLLTSIVHRSSFLCTTRTAPLLTLRIIFVGRHTLRSALAAGAAAVAAATALCPLGGGAASGVGGRRGGRRLGGRHDGRGRSGGAGVAGAVA